MELHIRTTASGRQYREYYHPQCMELKRARDRAVDLFYEYTGSLEPIKMVNIAFKQLKDQGLSEHEILYVLKYIIKNRCVLNYAMGIKYYATPAIKEYRSKHNFIQKQELNKQKDTGIGIVTETEESIFPRVDLEDDLDISSFL